MEYQPPPLNIHTPLIADTSGATAHYLQNPAVSNYLHTANPVINVQPTSNGVSMLLPNRTKIQAIHIGQLDIPSLPPEAKTAHIFPELVS